MLAGTGIMVQLDTLFDHVVPQCQDAGQARATNKPFGAPANGGTKNKECIKPTEPKQ